MSHRPPVHRLLFFTLLLAAIQVKAQTLPQLRVAPDGNYLETTTGNPFFYLGDTAWELLHRLNKTETRQYLTDRSAKGFNVIQTVILAELDGLQTPNAQGDLPLIDQDPNQPNPAYFEHVDWVLELADSLGLYLGLLPTWGDKFNLKWGVGPEIFNPENAEKYGAFLGERYRNHSIIWILGGDRNPEEVEDFAIIRQMANGLRSRTDTQQLITYHPQGGYSSADFFTNEDWIDFHMFQSGHGTRDNKMNYDFPRTTRSKAPSKPVINGEPLYEDHPINWRPINGWFTDFDARQAAYWSVFMGTAGHTFGNHNIWQMWTAKHEPISRARTSWEAALQYPAAAQMGYLKELLIAAHFSKLVNTWELTTAAPNSGGNTVVAMSGTTPIGNLALIYTPFGQKLHVRKNKISGILTTMEWFNPRTGDYLPASYQEENDHFVFDPPFDPQRGNDWVLRLLAN